MPQLLAGGDGVEYLLPARLGGHTQARQQVEACLLRGDAFLHRCDVAPNDRRRICGGLVEDLADLLQAQPERLEVLDGKQPGHVLL